MEGERNYYTEQYACYVLYVEHAGKMKSVYMPLCLFLMFPHSIETSTPKH